MLVLQGTAQSSSSLGILPGRPRPYPDGAQGHDLMLSRTQHAFVFWFLSLLVHKESLLAFCCNADVLLPLLLLLCCCSCRYCCAAAAAAPDASNAAEHGIIQGALIYVCAHAVGMVGRTPQGAKCKTACVNCSPEVITKVTLIISHYVDKNKEAPFCHEPSEQESSHLRAVQVLSIANWNVAPALTQGDLALYRLQLL